MSTGGIDRQEQMVAEDKSEGDASAQREPDYTVGLLADPGIAQTLAGRVLQPVRHTLNTRDEGGKLWEIDSDRQSLPVSAAGRVMINDHAESLGKRLGWDYVVYLTDIPQYVEGRPVRMIVSSAHRVATIVVPMMGLARRRTLIDWVLRAIKELHEDNETPEPSVKMPDRLLSMTGSVVHEQEPEDRFSTVEGLSGRLLLVFGMVRSNRPWRLVPRLSSAMAGAAATGAFGVFYTSIWQMADYLSAARLTLITLTSLAVLTTWLIMHNRLWESPRGVRRRERWVLYNVATLVTVGLAAAAMYLVLYGVLLLGALAVIDIEFLSEQLGHEASLDEYLNLAWLAASLGTMGGAIGSSFDDEQAVRQATFSHREYERRNLQLEEEDEESGE